MDVLLNCHPNHGGPTKQQVIQTMKRMKLDSDLVQHAEKTANKTELCKLLSTLNMDCKISTIPVMNRANCDQYFQNFRVLRMIGSGSQGKVFEIASLANPEDRRVVKMFVSSKDPNSTSFQRELFFMRYLQDKQLDGKPIVPRLYDSWQCKGELVPNPNNFEWKMKNRSFLVQYLVMEKYIDDVSLRAKIKGLNAEHVVVLFKLCLELGKLGIIGGDIKLDNFMYKLDSQNQYQFVIIDLGFAGWASPPTVSESKLKPEFQAEMGWMSMVEEWGCGKSQRKIPYTDITNVVEYATSINMTQLEASLLSDQIQIHESKENKTNYFIGVSGLNHSGCTKYDLYVSQIKNRLYTKNPYSSFIQFSYKNLIENTGPPFHSFYLEDDEEEEEDEDVDYDLEFPHDVR